MSPVAVHVTFNTDVINYFFQIYGPDNVQVQSMTYNPATYTATLNLNTSNLANGVINSLSLRESNL